MADALRDIAAFVRLNPDLPVFAVQCWADNLPADITPVSARVSDEEKRSAIARWAERLGVDVEEKADCRTDSWRDHDMAWTSLRVKGRISGTSRPIDVSLYVHVEEIRTPVAVAS
jgi:hypothetical protein